LTRVNKSFRSRPVLYAVTYEGVRVGSVNSLRSGRPRWVAYSAITHERAPMRFPTRRDASAWLVARYLAERERDREAAS
jgi:hypothetical protein